jgi:hypothetical protein
MKNRKVNHALLAALSSAACSPLRHGCLQRHRPQRLPCPFDTTLPDTHKMLTWSQADRVVGFRNDYRNYAGMFSATATLCRWKCRTSRSRTPAIR